MKCLVVGLVFQLQTFLCALTFPLQARYDARIRRSLSSAAADNPIGDMVTARLPTSVEDQVRQAIRSIQQAKSSEQQITRHNIRLLLPLIGATDLDDWPGGSRQMMVAAGPLVESIMLGLGISTSSIRKICIDESDGVYAWMGESTEAKDDCVFIILPTAESVPMIRDLDKQVGPKRNLVLVNPQWKRRSDFGGFFGVDEKSASYVESFHPSFSLTNFICEGEAVRVLHTLGNGGWRVYLRKELDNGDVDWFLLGEQDYKSVKPSNWSSLPGSRIDGGRLFDYGIPSYQEIVRMLNSSPSYTPKNPAERASSAFSFIKDSL